MAERDPTLKISVALAENGDVLETLYTEATWADVSAALRSKIKVFDTEEQLDQAVEGDIHG